MLLITIILNAQSTVEAAHIAALLVQGCKVGTTADLLLLYVCITGCWFDFSLLTLKSLKCEHISELAELVSAYVQIYKSDSSKFYSLLNTIRYPKLGFFNLNNF